MGGRAVVGTCSAYLYDGFCDAEYLLKRVRCKFNDLVALIH